MTNGIQVYGTDWCSLTFSVREHLTNSRIPYDYYDIDQDQRAEAFVLAMHDGRRRFPVIVVEERIITCPTLKELQKVLNEHQVRPAVTRK
jgi:thioredoxin reductase (NADPH)